MTAQEFAYWLQGYAELSGDVPPTTSQWLTIKDHLNLVFEKVTPARPIIRTRLPEFEPYPLPPPGQTTVTCATNPDTSTTLLC